MGIFHWMQNNELKKDQQTIIKMDDAEIDILRDQIEEELGHMSVIGVNPDEILESDSFNIADNSHWANCAITISSTIRVPLAVDQSDFGNMRYLAVSIILHSVRAVINYELHNKKTMLIRCQDVWNRLAKGNKELIPKRFR